MKNCILLMIFAALLAGCSKSNQSSVSVEAEGRPAAAQNESDKKGIEVEYSYSQKNEFVANLKKEMANVNDEIEKLSDKIANSTEKAKEEAKPKLEALKEKAKNLDVEIDKAENATAETWDDVKAHSKKALSDMKEGFREARAWAAEKIAP